MSGREAGPERGSRPSIVIATKKRRGPPPESAHTCLGSRPRTRDPLWVATRELVERVIIGSQRGFGNILFGND